MYTRKVIKLSSTLAVTFPKKLSEAAGLRKGWPVRLSFIQPDIIVIQSLRDPDAIEQDKIIEHLKTEEKDGGK